MPQLKEFLIAVSQPYLSNEKQVEIVDDIDIFSPDLLADPPIRTHIVEKSGTTYLLLEFLAQGYARKYGCQSYVINTADTLIDKEVKK